MIDWEEFYDSYPRGFGPTEYLKQAGHTIDGRPISGEQFEIILNRMEEMLGLEQGDSLLDLCCGNGVFTQQLAKKCGRVVGVDFSEPLLEIAERDHGRGNLTYHLMNALDLDTHSEMGSNRFTKVVMCGALQHFELFQLETLIGSLIDLTSEDRVIVFLLVPDCREKWAFYNTAPKRIRHLVRKLMGRERMGTWWRREDIERTCLNWRLRCSFREMDARLHESQYRFDVRIV